MMCHTRNITALIGDANPGAADSTQEVCFLDRMILIFLRLQYESRYGLPDRNPSKRKVFP